MPKSLVHEKPSRPSPKEHVKPTIMRQATWCKLFSNSSLVAPSSPAALLPRSSLLQRQGKQVLTFLQLIIPAENLYEYKFFTPN